MALGSLAVKVLRLEELLAAREAQLAEADESGQEWLADADKLRQAVGDTLAVLGEHQLVLEGVGGGGGQVEPVAKHTWLCQWVTRRQCSVIEAGSARGCWTY